VAQQVIIPDEVLGLLTLPLQSKQEKKEGNDKRFFHGNKLFSLKKNHASNLLYFPLFFSLRKAQESLFTVNPKACVERSNFIYLWIRAKELFAALPEITG
jgi:hypothetical protein